MTAKEIEMDTETEIDIGTTDSATTGAGMVIVTIERTTVAVRARGTVGTDPSPHLQTTPPPLHQRKRPRV